MKTIEERANDAYAFCETERENAIGRKNTGGWYFPSVYRSGYIKGATEQMEIDEHAQNNSLNALYEKHQKQLAKYDADLKETQRQRDECYDELVKLRIERAEWMDKAWRWIELYRHMDVHWTMEQMKNHFIKAMKK